MGSKNILEKETIGKNLNFLPYRTNAAEIFQVFRFLKDSQNSHENTGARVSFLIKLQAETCNFIKKEALAQVFVNFAKFLIDTFSYRTPPVAASK